jgi:hypothetical protein
MNKTYIGIDPGLKGGISVIRPNTPPEVFAMPLIAKEELDVVKIVEIIYRMIHTVVVIEDVHSVFGASASANFSFGFGCGSLFTILKLSKVPFVKVPPKQWQKEMWQGVRPIEVIVPGKKNKDGSPKYKIDTKATSLLAATRLFPNVDFRATPKCKTAHDGVIDSLLMAEYGRRKNY